MSDFRREYGMSARELAAIDVHEFTWLLQGLSQRARFVQAWDQEPKNVYDPSDIAAIKAAARR